MGPRIAKVALCASVLALLPGCIEMTETFTLNPDGRGKVKIEILVPAYDFDLGMALGKDGGKKEKSLDELRQEAITKFVRNAPGVTAWKDVSVTWSRDGRLQMAGTAYFERLEDLDQDRAKGPIDPTNLQPSKTFGGSLRLERQQDGTLRLTGKNHGIKEGMFKPNENKEAVDFSKMTDKELDEFLLRWRVEYQKLKPLLTMMFADLKVKMVIHLPGEVVEVKGCKKEGRTVTQSFEGKTVLEMCQRVITLDAADVRKLAPRDPKDLFALVSPVEAFTDPDVTINQLKAQFDYDAEVRAARAAYPRLRKALSMSDDVPLPGETK